MIPRILHYVWVGGRPLPEKARINIATWRRFCPDFEIRAWTDANVAFDQPYLARCRALGHWANASNFLRLEKLVEHGGVYLDVDIMVRRPLLPLLRDRCFLGFQVGARENDWVNNAVFGAEPGHWFAKLCRDRLLAEFDGSEPANHSSPRLVTRLLVELGLTASGADGTMVRDIRVHPHPVFYPYSWRQEFALESIRPETVTVHFWEKSWRPGAAEEPADADVLRARLEKLAIAHHRLIRDAVLALEPGPPGGGVPTRPWRWLARLALAGRRAARPLALACAAVLASLSPAGAAAEACAVSFDDPDLAAGVRQTGGVTIRPVGCSADPAAPQHCIVPALADAGSSVDARFAAPVRIVRPYRLWLRVATSARAGTIGLSLNGEPPRAWFVPPTQPGGWQLVTLADGRTAAAFEVKPGDNALRIALPKEGGRAEVAVDCAVLAADPDFAPGLKAIHRLDRAWSGVGVLFDALAGARSLHVGYYNAERMLSVAAFDRAARTWHRTVLASRFDGWDNHNAIALAVDGTGRLHVAGNMHASPLVYAHTVEPGRIDSLLLRNRMVGRDEARVTYPSWIAMPDGGLAFFYRSGVSGAGQHIINLLVDGQWRRAIDTPLFGQAAGGFSAYPTQPVRGPDGRLHMAWVWRRTSEAQTTFQVSYARSDDLVHWMDAAGRALALPLLPGPAGRVDDVPEGAGLANQVVLGFDVERRPVVSYLKFDARGATQLYNARPRADGSWEIVQASDWQDRWAFAGRGTIPALIRLEAAAVDPAGALVQGVRHWRAGRFEFVLDAATLRPLATRPPRRPLPWAMLQPTTAEPGFFAIAIPVRDAADSGRATGFVLRWEAQSSERDAMPACTPQRPRACDPPPSELALLEMR
jgi:hypothetical protein